MSLIQRGTCHLPRAAPFIPLMRLARDIRVRKGITTLVLAGKIGYDRSTIAHWERGCHVPSLQNFLNYCEGLGLSVNITEE